MKESAIAIASELVKRFEGLQLQAYVCPAGAWTIGYGHTEGVHPDQVITEAEADLLLAEDVATFAVGVAELVRVPLNPCKVAALISFAFNVGLDALKKSTLLRYLNEGRPDVEIAMQFRRWVYANGRILPGLMRRRNAEAGLYLSRWSGSNDNSE